MFNFRLVAVFLSVALSFGSPLSAQLNYEGSSSLGDSLIPELAKDFTAKTGIQFGTINPTNSAQGFQGVKSGKAAIGGLSRLLTQEELKDGFANRVIGYDAVVVYVNLQNPIKNITIAQLKSVFSGKIVNWKDLGGSDVPIVVLVKLGGEEGGVVGQFKELVMAGESMASPSLAFPSHQENVEYVASNPAAITFASLAGDKKTGRILSVEGVDPSRKALLSGEYPLARPYLVIFKSNPPEPDVAKFIEFVFSSEGQAIVQKFVVPVVSFDGKEN